ncbi:Effector protein YopJ (Virulence factor YopJ) [Pseudovibrio sp. FO-BEG1]|uniref:YopJ family acetyltransferase n=1 Tax=Pseudovibrio sp. (strain FO-BEG1) TaxID=911045 RepID=UPI000238D21C|nr:YopJ family acetyltransferase [Pseudovibrio sp. FO-BEG1]AEV38694.1 Effector protein YopJ (Virulence factor YopJ) [Pseudovibrio sp. FO-BEG1]
MPLPQTNPAEEKWIVRVFQAMGINPDRVKINQKPIREFAAGQARDKAYIEEYYQALEEALENDEPLTEELSFGDIAHFGLLVDMANEKEPGLNVKLCADPDAMGEEVEQMQKSGEENGRFIVNRGGDGMHFAAFDYLVVDGKPSIVGIEPAIMDPVKGISGHVLAAKAARAFKKRGIDVKMTIIEADMQRSPTDCNIFSLSLVKKMLKDKEEVAKIHAQNTNGELPSQPIEGQDSDSFSYIKHTDSDRYLTPSMMKHAHSPNRMRTYLKNHEGAAEAKVNKKDETLQQRMARHIIERKPVPRPFSNSIEHKRKTEYGNFLGKKKQ